MSLLKLQKEDIFSFLSSRSVNDKIIELLKKLGSVDFDALFSDKLNAKHFRASVYEPCIDLLQSKRGSCIIVVYPNYISFFVPISSEREYEVVIGVNDSGLLFSNIAYSYHGDRKWFYYETTNGSFVRKYDAKELGKHDLFNVGRPVPVYFMETEERIHKLFGYDTELSQPTTTIDVSTRKVIRVQGNRTLIVEPFSTDALQRIVLTGVETYMRYMWIDAIISSFVNNHITAYPDEFMNIVVRRFFWSFAPWVDSRSDMMIKTKELVDFLVNWFSNVANIHAEQAAPTKTSLYAVTPRDCEFSSISILLSTSELGKAIVRIGYCYQNRSLLLRPEALVLSESAIVKVLIQDIMENLKNGKRFSLTRYFGNHKVIMENVVSLPFNYEPPDSYKLKMLEPATIRVGEDRRGWYYVDEKSIVRFEHPEHSTKEVSFNGPAFISIGSINVAPEHIDLMNVLAINDYAILYEIEHI
jgi:hypothetical protein